MSPQIQKNLFFNSFCQDSMSISTTSFLPGSVASGRLSSTTSSMSARSIGGKGFLQYWKELYCQNSSLSFGKKRKRKVYQQFIESHFFFFKAKNFLVLKPNSLKILWSFILHLQQRHL